MNRIQRFLRLSWIIALIVPHVGVMAASADYKAQEVTITEKVVNFVKKYKRPLGIGAAVVVLVGIVAFKSQIFKTDDVNKVVYVSTILRKDDAATALPEMLLEDASLLRPAGWPILHFVLESGNPNPAVALAVLNTNLVDDQVNEEHWGRTPLMIALGNAQNPFNAQSKDYDIWREVITKLSEKGAVLSEEQRNSRPYRTGATYGELFDQSGAVKLEYNPQPIVIGNHDGEIIVGGCVQPPNPTDGVLITGTLE